MSLVNADDVKKSFGEVEALKGIDLEVQEGEIIGFLGPNGAGKSTMVNILTGQLERDSGEVEVMGMDPEREPVDLRSKIGILPEREDPPSFLTGDEYLEMISDVRSHEIERDSWVERLGLEGKMDNLTRDLSKGERQKLMVIQALFHRPRLVFVDEPLINLDPVVQEEVKDIFRNHRDNGNTLFLCTHVVSLAEELCDRVVFLRDGEVIDVIEEVENLKERFLEEQ